MGTVYDHDAAAGPISALARHLPVMRMVARIPNLERRLRQMMWLPSSMHYQAIAPAPLAPYQG
jgi:hypothetical protein